MTSTFSITGELRPWITPKTAIVLVGEVELKLHVSQIADPAFDALAAQWLNDLYASIERASPFRLDIAND